MATQDYEELARLKRKQYLLYLLGQVSKLLSSRQDTQKKMR